MLSKHAKKQYIFLGLASLLLFFIMQNSGIIKEEGVETEENIQTREVSPNELFLDSYKLVRTHYWDKEASNERLNAWKKRYAGKIKDEEDAKVAINSMLASLNDPYSKFLDKKEFEEQNSYIDSKIYGIGVNIATDAGKIIIVNVIKGTPADYADLHPMDMIVKINDENVQGKSLFQVISDIKNPNNEIVNLEILRGNKRLAKHIKKTEIKIKTVKAEILDKEIGYIKISSFISSDTPVEFIDALNKVKDTRALILDLRGNTGGLFQNAVFVADLFLKNKVIVSVLGRSGTKNMYRSHENGYVYDKPMAVLVNNESASASEIVSGALKDNKRAYIVGTQTFGKGLVQKVFSMPNNTGLNLTIARYLTPNDTDINKKGITPDYVVQISLDDSLANKDRQLEFAKNTLTAEIERSKLAEK